jgi:EAL domain-containing protein (putative c-di-GMP-specific phosphodiesterase class I)
MPSVDNSSIESLHRSTSVTEDAWFLVGPTQSGEDVLHASIDRDPYIVGRGSGVSLYLRFRTVSGRHASLSVKQGELFLQDLGSTNGTFVNGTRIERDQPVRVVEDDLIHIAEAPFRVCRQSAAQLIGTYADNVCDQALAMVQFDRLMSERLVRPHFQSIVSLSDASSIGFEILGRGSVFGLESAGALFQVADQLNLQVELSQLLRWEGIRVGCDLPGRPTLFVNTHPREMIDADGLVDSLRRVRNMAGDTKLVLEIHEASVTNPALMKMLHASLRELDMLLAYDDFGAGQARLAELIEARPDFVKFDISLIHDIDKASESRRGMLETLVKMVRDLDIRALAEGIETAEEGEACLDLGFELAQGYFYGRPAPV